MLTASVIHAEHNIALLCHPDVPTSCAPMWGGINVVGMRTAIDIHDCRVFLGGVEVGGKNETVVKIGHSISSLESAHLDFWHIVVSPRIVSIEHVPCLLALCVDDINATREFGRTVLVDDETSCR